VRAFDSAMNTRDDLHTPNQKGVQIMKTFKNIAASALLVGLTIAIGLLSEEALIAVAPVSLYLARKIWL
jgi:hypothetical protein